MANPARPRGAAIGQFPSWIIRQAEMADFALPAHVFKTAQHLCHMVKRLSLVLAGRVIGPVLAKHVGATIWPMQLVKIDIIRLQ